MSKYGMPYKGSKDKIAEKIISVLPENEYFVDLFGGGGAVIDCAMQSGKYIKGLYNELEPLVYKAFKMAMNGDFKNEQRWISRKEFFELKDIDPYAAICFSFGNDLKTYAYSPEIERFKKWLHYMFFAESPKQARLHWKAFIKEFSLVKSEISELTQKALALCSECSVEPIYKQDGSLDAKKIKDNVFKAKSAHIRKYMRDALAQSGLKQSHVDKYLGNQMSGHYFGQSQWSLPTLEQYQKLQEIIPQLTIPWGELNEKLEVLKNLDTLQRLESLERLQRLESLERLQSLQSLESLERLERLQRLQRLERLHNVTCSNLSYEQVEIPENSVVYCDIPYKNTSSYLSSFDYEKFYNWCRNSPHLIFVSEYIMPDDFYVCAEWDKTCTLTPNNRTKTKEKLFCNKPYRPNKQLTF